MKNISKKWRDNNPEKWKEINQRNVKLWRENNPEKYKAQYMSYNQRLRDKKDLTKSKA